MIIVRGSFEFKQLLKDMKKFVPILYYTKILRSQYIEKKIVFSLLIASHCSDTVIWYLTPKFCCLCVTLLNTAVLLPLREIKTQ